MTALQLCAATTFADWDESGFDACRREMWEECKINVDDLMSRFGIMNSPKNVDNLLQPWLTVSEPGTDKLQNVSLHFGLILDIPGALPKPEGELSEIQEARWFPEDQLPPAEKVAFGHDKRFRQFMERFRQSTAEWRA